ncbi:hypothetical protein EJ08DRAFT_628843 [Tothia fuscella]|uniref:LITAF domain-containing protein n=1 Tax=Tothia fuscella TaxID=1048955 RepID=A0A9P4U246_9PEZI|nr:hypothetical protein EJ08DRAFT_628843 [Tothia fuscella]
MEKPGEPPAYTGSGIPPPGTQPTQYPHPAISPPLSNGAGQPQYLQHQQSYQGQPPMQQQHQQEGMHPQQPQQPDTVYQQPHPQHGQPVYQQQQPGQQGHPQQAGVQPQSMFKTVVPLQALGGSPAPIDCPSCHQRGLTNTHHMSGDCTHLWALGFCCFICLPCIPYLIDSFKDVEHKCGRCGTNVATWKRSGGTQVHVFS